MNKYMNSEDFFTKQPVSIIPSTKQIKKKPKFDKSLVRKIINVQFPEYLIPGGKYKSKYKVRISYKDEKEKIHEKTVFFGKSDRIDFIDHKIERLRDNYLKNLKQPESEFDPVFWDNLLLNGKESDLITNFQILRNKIIS